MIRLATDTLQSYGNIPDGRLAPTRDQYSEAMSNAADLAQQSWSQQQADRDYIDTQLGLLGEKGFNDVVGDKADLYKGLELRAKNDNQPLTEDYIVKYLPGRLSGHDTRTDEQIAADKLNQAKAILAAEAAYNQAAMNSQSGQPHEQNTVKTTDQIIDWNIKRANEAEAKANDYSARIRDRSWDVDLYYGAKTAFREPLNIAGMVVTAPIAAEAIAANIGLRLLGIATIEGGVGAVSQMGVEAQMNNWYRQRGLTDQEIDDRWAGNVAASALGGAALGPLGYLLGKGIGKGVAKGLGVFDRLSPAERAANLARARGMTPDDVAALTDAYHRLTTTKTNDELFAAIDALEPDKLKLSVGERLQLDNIKRAAATLNSLPEDVRSNPKITRPFLAAMGKAGQAITSDDGSAVARAGVAQLEDLQLDAAIAKFQGDEPIALSDLDAFPEVKAALLKKNMPEAMSPAAYKVLGLQQQILEATAAKAPADEIASLTAQASAIRAKLSEAEQAALGEAEKLFDTARVTDGHVKGTAFSKADVLSALVEAKTASTERMAALKSAADAQTPSPKSEDALDAEAQATREQSATAIANDTRSLNKTPDLGDMIKRDGLQSFAAITRNETLPEEFRTAMQRELNDSREEDEALAAIEACLFAV